MHGYRVAETTIRDSTSPGARGDGWRARYGGLAAGRAGRPRAAGRHGTRDPYDIGGPRVSPDPPDRRPRHAVPPRPPAPVRGRPRALRGPGRLAHRGGARRPQALRRAAALLAHPLADRRLPSGRLGVG